MTSEAQGMLQCEKSLVFVLCMGQITSNILGLVFKKDIDKQGSHRGGHEDCELTGNWETENSSRNWEHSSWEEHKLRIFEPKEPYRLCSSTPFLPVIQRGNQGLKTHLPDKSMCPAETLQAGAGRPPVRVLVGHPCLQGRCTRGLPEPHQFHKSMISMVGKHHKVERKEKEMQDSEENGGPLLLGPLLP